MRFTGLKLRWLKLQKIKVGMVALATALALTISLMGPNVAWAQDGGESAETTAETTVRPREAMRQAGLEAAAETLRMTPEEVADQLWGGKTLADLAEEANVPLSDVRAAVEAATGEMRQERVQEFIAKQVAEGRMSQAQADWINEGIDNGWFGFLDRLADRFDGFGRGRFAGE